MFLQRKRGIRIYQMEDLKMAVLGVVLVYWLMIRLVNISCRVFKA